MQPFQLECPSTAAWKQRCCRRAGSVEAGSMSYTTQDRYGGFVTKYAHGRGGGPSGNVGRTWWPDFGPSSNDFSYMSNGHPAEHLYERHVKPMSKSNAHAEIPSPKPVQFRHPAPSKEAMMSTAAPSPEAKHGARQFIEKQAALRRLELRQRAVDSYLEDAPIRSVTSSSSFPSPQRATLSHSRSDPSLSALGASEASRDVYTTHGFAKQKSVLAERSRGSIADGRGGLRQKRHNSLSFHAMLFGGEVEQKPSRARLDRPFLLRKPGKQWHVCPESSFVFDAERSLPVPRGGLRSQRPSKWPDAEPAGSREFRTRDSFDPQLALCSDLADSSKNFASSGRQAGAISSSPAVVAA